MTPDETFLTPAEVARLTGIFAARWTDVDEKLGIEGAKDQLGHASASMTRSYVRNRRGKLVDPTA